MKKYILLVLTLALFSFSAVWGAGGENEEEDVRQSLITNSFRDVPNDQIIHIGEYLYGPDFHNFKNTCKVISMMFTGHPSFFMPHNDSDELSMSPCFNS